MHRVTLVIALVSLILSAVSPVPSTEAAETAPQGSPATIELGAAEYAVYMEDAALATYRGAIIGLEATSPEARGEQRLDPSSAASQAYLAYLDAQRSALVSLMSLTLGRSVSVGFTYSYAVAGFSTTLTPAEAATVATLPNVASVHRQEHLETLTDNGPAWMDADDVWSGAAGVAGTRGEGIVVGIIDTGVNSKHPSFADPGPVDGYDHQNPRGRRYGMCVTDLTKCNDKLIGMYNFTTINADDDVGHGSHTAGTAAGNVVDATLYTPTGVTVTRRISGVAPHANIISYRVCHAPNFVVPVANVNLGTCPLTALIAGIDQATADVVDVINFSIGGGSVDPWTDPLGLPFLGARAAGVFSAASAGNNGPNATTLGRPANSPWVMAVGASTHDRRPTGRVQLSGGASAHPEIVGMSISSGLASTPVVDAKALGNELCNPFTAAQAAEIAGRVVVCTQGVIGRVAKGQNVQAGGGAGMILVSQPGYKNSVVADAHVIPAVQIGEIDGASLRAWLASGSGHAATLVGLTLEESASLADRMAGFSSRGPDLNLQNVIKPDVTAPGVAILAAWNAHPGPADKAPYAMIQGTSMSSPHAAGAAALVRATHRLWDPDQVKSALMSTSVTAGVTKEDHTTAADPFDRGGGRINVARAVKAGFTLPETTAGYIAADPAFAGPGGQRGLNIASAANDDCQAVCSWTRTLLGNTASAVTWTVTATGSSGFSLSVSPSTFTLGGTLPSVQRVTITATNTGLVPSFWEFGSVTFTPSDPSVPVARFPVAVKSKGAAPAQACFIPSTTVVTDPAGDITPGTNPIPGQVALTPGHDIREIGVAGRYPTFGGYALPNISFRMKVESLSIVPPNAFWWVTFVPQGAPANVNYFVGMWSSSTGATSFTYGTVNFVAGTFATLGAPESGSFTPDGTITMTIAASKILNPPVGSTLTNITGYSGPAQQGLVTFETEWTTGGSYTLGECQNAELSVSGLTVAGEKDATTISVLVSNTGRSDATGVPVAFSANGAPIGDVLVDLPAGSSATVTIGWSTKHLRGDFVVTATVDPANAVPELNESDNSVSKLVTVRGNRVQ